MITRVIWFGAHVASWTKSVLIMRISEIRLILEKKIEFYFKGHMINRTLVVILYEIYETSPRMLHKFLKMTTRIRSSISEPH